MKPEQIVALVFEAVPAIRCMIMMRDERTELKVAVARLRDRVGEVGRDSHQPFGDRPRCGQRPSVLTDAQAIRGLRRHGNAAGCALSFGGAAGASQPTSLESSMRLALAEGVHRRSFEGLDYLASWRPSASRMRA